MNLSLAFFRVFYLIISIFLMTAFMTTLPLGSMGSSSAIGVGVGLLFGAFLIGADLLFRRFSLRSFNIAILGIFLGYLMGQALVFLFSSAIEITHIKTALQPQTTDLIKLALLLFGTYMGSIMTLKAADEIYVSIPFVKFSPVMQKKKDLILDASVLQDARIIDVAASGVFDFQLIIPRFIVKELHARAESTDEGEMNKARRSLETIRKLEALEDLGLRINETDFPEVKDLFGKLSRLARLLDANLLTADLSRAQAPNIEGVKIINIHSLSHALKPLMRTGEVLRIKIQRYGKEPNQGVGYLDDGTMVVVNGGGDFIGESIDASVLSVKHTSTGRMIFCNTMEEGAVITS